MIIIRKVVCVGLLFSIFDNVVLLVAIKVGTFKGLA